MSKSLSRDEIDHIARLHAWAAQAAARGDMESSERLQSAAHRVFERGVARTVIAKATA